MENNEADVCAFKKEFIIKDLPSEFIIHVSADNRYKLYINDVFINEGPQKGDFNRWRYETINIIDYLKEGTNVIKAVVWDLKNLRPQNQISSGLSFILEGPKTYNNLVSTNNTWLVNKIKPYSFFPIKEHNGYYAVGPGEKLDLNIKNSNWVESINLEKGLTIFNINKYGVTPKRILYPRAIKLLTHEKKSLKKLRRSNLFNNRIEDGDSLFPIKIPPNTIAKFLFDNEKLTTAYPNITFSNGNQAKVKITYAESLFNYDIESNKILTTKGNRNEIVDKRIIGNYDEIILDGGLNMIFEPLNWRTFRFIELEVETLSEELFINNFETIFTTYLLEQKSTFRTNDANLNAINNTAWHTQQICTNEMFMDCPYYEQLQYAGDSRIQALNVFYAANDSKLWKNALEDFFSTQTPYGLLSAQHPSIYTQIIPGYSLTTILMLHDYYMHVDDKEYVDSKIPHVLKILDWFNNNLNEEGLVSDHGGWNFVDWVDSTNWDSGIPPLDSDKSSSILSLQYAYALKHAIYLLEQTGYEKKAVYFKEKREILIQEVLKNYYDSKNEILYDNRSKNIISQHVNIFGILNDIPIDKKFIEENLFFETENIGNTSYYFEFYKIVALSSIGYNYYPIALNKWKEMLKLGLSTFPETKEETRSDCHGWSASPLYFNLSLIGGIKPLSPGFKSILIEPNFFDTEMMEVKFEHYKGSISINLLKKENQVKGEIIIPEDINVMFKINQNTIKLKHGINRIEMKF